jgi:hypothetical protein
MDRNQKTVFLGGLLTVILLALGSYIFFRLKSTDVVHCPDGTTHPKMDAAGFATEYTGYSAKLQAKLNEKGDFSAELGTQKLQEMSEAMQQARLHMQSLAEGYNACAVDPSEFNDARNRYQRMEDIARQINEISSHIPLKTEDEVRLKQLIDEYIRSSHSGKTSTP